MEQLVALHQREAADMARRHSLQMAEKREAMTRRKLERKSLLGGAHGVGSASSMSSAGDGHASAPSGRSSYDGGLTGSRPIRAHPIGATNPIGFEPAPAPTSHSGATVAGRRRWRSRPRTRARGRCRPGARRPRRAGVSQAGRPPPAAAAAAAAAAAPRRAAAPRGRPRGGSGRVPPAGARAQHPLSTPPQPPRAPTPSPQQQAAHPTPVQQLSQTTSAAAMSRSASNGSVGGHQSSGNTSDDGKPSEKAAKQAKAKEKLLMMEASALLNLDGFSKAAGGEEREGRGHEEEGAQAAACGGGGERRRERRGTAPRRSSRRSISRCSSSSKRISSSFGVSSSGAPPRCASRSGRGDAGRAAHGSVRETHDVRGRGASGRARRAGRGAVQRGHPAEHGCRASGGDARLVQQQAQQVQQHQQAQQAQMQEASDAFEATKKKTNRRRDEPRRCVERATRCAHVIRHRTRRKRTSARLRRVLHATRREAHYENAKYPALKARLNTHHKNTRARTTAPRRRGFAFFLCPLLGSIARDRLRLIEPSSSFRKELVPSLAAESPAGARCLVAKPGARRSQPPSRCRCPSDWK